MPGRFDDLLDTTFAIPQDEGSDKVVPLAEAIRRHVKPGMSLHITETTGAAVCQLLREFRGTRPGFTLMMIGVGGYSMFLVHAGLVKKIITSLCGGGGRTPSFNPIIQKVFQDGSVEIENWSLFSIPQRFMAGALGVPFMPTRSILGSSMAQENVDSFKVIDDPFGSGRQASIVKALNPDVSLAHACVADRYGNAILPQAGGNGHGPWGIFATTKAVILTVEKIVSTDFIREHSHLVRLPGHLVSSVSVVPFGAHPGALIRRGVRGFETYGEDDDFVDRQAEALEKPETLDDFIKEWVLDCRDQQDYLDKLGYQRLLFLKGKARDDSWEDRLDHFASNVSTSDDYNTQEMMVVAVARQVQERVANNGFKLVLGGGGISGLGAWMALYRLKEEGYDVDLVLGSGWLGHLPRPGNASLVNAGNAASIKVASDVLDAYGVWVGGPKSAALSVLAAAQVDKHGNINSTKVPGKMYFTGSGGANDAVNARQVVVVLRQSRERYLEKVDYITCPGHNVKAVVSNLGLFEKTGDSQELVLTGYYPGSRNAGERIQQVKERCGWELKVSPQVKEVPRPTAKDLQMLRVMDPERQFIGK